MDLPITPENRNRNTRLLQIMAKLFSLSLKRIWSVVFKIQRFSK